MIVVTGGTGFIGSHLVLGLNRLGYTKILIVDDLTEGRKFKNIVDAKFIDYMDYEDFLEKIINRKTFANPIKAIFHQGACSTTTEWDGRYMLRNNYDYSKYLLHYCIDAKIPFIYASSAAIYGTHTHFKETTKNPKPLNIYGYSKWLFDQYVLRLMPEVTSQIVGLRYFNVYGPHEEHKGSMASVAFHFMNQLIKNQSVRLFEGSHGFEAGEQRRDFIYVEDVVNINLWFFQQAKKSGIFNVGTGNSHTFNEVARILIKLYGSGSIDYIPFPEHLKASYQSFTEADINTLLNSGFSQPFATLEEGLKKYWDYYHKHLDLNT